MKIKFFSNIWKKIKQLGRARETTDDRIRSAMRDAMLLIVRSAKMNLSGPVLKTRTGQLRSEVRFEEPEISGHLISGKVGLTRADDSSGPGLYGNAWEYGYQVPPTKIVAKSKKALSFWWWAKSPRSLGGVLIPGEGIGGKMLVKSIMRPAYRVFPRPWLAPAVEENRIEIFRILQKAGIQLVENKK